MKHTIIHIGDNIEDDFLHDDQGIKEHACQTPLGQTQLERGQQ